MTIIKGRAPRVRWTRDQAYWIMNQGVLKGKWELLDGEIVSKMGMNGPHAIAIGLVMGLLIRLFGANHVRIQLPIRIPGELGRYNEPEPDAVVTRQTGTVYREHPTPEEILLVVEVSDSTLADDLETKADLYAQAGIEEYWVLDVTGRRLHVFGTAEGYKNRVIKADEGVTCLAEPDEIVWVADLLPPLEESP